MKKFAKKLAVVLALTTAVTTVQATPIATKAASSIVLSSGKAAPSAVYAGHSYSLKVAGTSVKFFSSNKAVATVGMTKGKFKPVKPGTVKIVAKSTKTKKVIATKTFTVRQRSTSIAADATELNLNANDTAVIKTALTPSNSTDAIRMYSTNKAVAKVGMTSGKVTAVADGTATIKIYAKASAKTRNSSKYNKIATVTVNVGACMDSAAQTAKNQVKLTFKTDMSAYKLAATDFSIVNDESKSMIAVKEVAVSGKEVTLTTYADVMDGKSYTVNYGKTTAQFTATEGKMASIAIVTTAVPYGTITPVKAVAKDDKGIIVGEYEYGKTANDANIVFSLTTTDGFTSAEGVYLNALTSTATANITYHTYKYENGVEVGNITSGDVTIAATNQSAVTASGISYSVSKDPVDFTSGNYKQNVVLLAGATDNKAYLNIKNTAGTVVSATGYSVTSSDSNTLVVTGAFDVTTNSVAIQGVKAGTAYLQVKNSAGAIIATLPVTVSAASAVNHIEASSTSFALSNVAGTYDTKDVVLNVKDQYNNKLAFGTDDKAVAVECLKFATGSDKTDAEYAVIPEIADNTDVKVTFDMKNLEAGTYVYKLTACGKSVVITVNVLGIQDNAAIEYKTMLDTDVIDTTLANVTDPADATKDIGVLVGKYKGALISKTRATPQIFAISDINSYELKTAAVKIMNGSTDVTSDYFDETIGEINVVKETSTPGVFEKMPAGTYTVCTTVTYVKTDSHGSPMDTIYTCVLPTASFKVTDAEKVPTIKVKASKTTKNTKADILNEVLDVQYNGSAVNMSENTVDAETEMIDGIGCYVFKKVTFTYEVAAGIKLKCVDNTIRTFVKSV